MKRLVLFLLLMVPAVCLAQSNEIKPPLGTQIENWPQGLVGWWLLNEGVGPHVNDLSGNGNAGTLGCEAGYTPPSWVAGYRGPAVRFVSTQRSFISWAANHLDKTAGTLSFWVADNGTPAWRYYWAWYLSSSNFLGVARNGSNDYFFYSQSGGNTQYINVAGGAPANATWHQVVATWLSGGNAYLYYDARLVGQVGYTAPVGATTATLWIGIATGAGETIDATVDSVNLFNRALTPAEIGQLYYDSYAAFRCPSVEYYVTAAAPPAGGTSQVIIIAKAMSPVAIPFSVIGSMAFLMRRERRAA